MDGEVALINLLKLVQLLHFSFSQRAVVDSDVVESAIRVVARF